MNRFSKLIRSLKYPIIQAPMAGGIVSPAMIAAITQSGGLGSIPLGYLDAKTAEDVIKKTIEVTSGPFSVNIFIPSPSQTTTDEQIEKMLKHVNIYREKLGLKQLSNITPLNESTPELLIDIAKHHGIKIISFTFGSLSPTLIQELHQQDMTIIGTATTTQEGLFLQNIGCDAVIAQGYEAGGHRGGGYLNQEPSGEIGTMALVPQMADALSIPVIAAGGIMNGRGIVAALTLGAKAVQMGTAFLACQESLASDLHKQLLTSSHENSTYVTTAFTGKPARGFKNQYVDETEALFSPGEILPYPLQHQATKDFRAAANRLKMPQWASFWSGQGHRLSASTTVSKLMEQLGQEIDDASSKTYRHHLS